MREFILGVVMDVLRHVGVKHRQGSGVCRAAAASGNFVVLHSSKFVVLLPEIGFQNFRGRQKSQNCRIPFRKTSAFFFLVLLAERGHAVG